VHRFGLTMTLRILGTILLASALPLRGPAVQQQDNTTAPLDLPISRSTRMLIVAPHPDDEVLAAGGLIQRVAAKGGALRIVWLTSGDGFVEGLETIDGVGRPSFRDYRSYGSLRESESRTATALLGLPRRSLQFLGFPDGGLCPLASTYLSAKAGAFESPYTDRTRPPQAEQVIRGVRYRGIDLRRELERIIFNFSPTVVVFPHAEDDHPDHCATHIFVREALDATSQHPRELGYLIHYDQWPPASGAGSDLRPPATFPSAEGRWSSFALEPHEMVAKKRALLAYSSQTMVIGRFMMGFSRANELFLEGKPASRPECWCDATVVATTAKTTRRVRRPARAQ
jgi:LmbE family N-acetylglucosaminyl deacetylase